MHVQTGCSGNDSDIVIPSLPCSDSQPRFLMDGLGTNTEFGSNRMELQLYDICAKRVKSQVPQNLLIVICFGKNMLQYL